MIFENRKEAGELLAQRLKKYQGRDVVVLGIPRGGVVAASEAAGVLDAPLDVVVSRKLGAPGNPELAVGAVDSRGNVFLHKDLVARLGITGEYLEKVKREEMEEAKRREKAFRGNRRPLSLKGKTVVIVDDGIATGATVLTAVRSVRKQAPKRLVLAAPVASSEAVRRLVGEVDDLIVLCVPPFFAAVGQFYREFGPTTDEEVKRILGRERYASS